MVGADLGDVTRELRTLNRNLGIIATLMKYQIREQRAQNVMFSKAYKLSWEEVKDEDEENKRKWA